MPISPAALFTLRNFRLHWPAYWMCVQCRCTEYDCSGCIERTGEPCYWVGPRLCSACVA